MRDLFETEAVWSSLTTAGSMNEAAQGTFWLHLRFPSSIIVQKGRVACKRRTPTFPAGCPLWQLLAEGRSSLTKLGEAGVSSTCETLPDFSRKGMGHCFARPWKLARRRYETILSLFRDILQVTPGTRRFYGVL